MDNKAAIKIIEARARKKGKTELLRHLEGKKLTRAAAISAKCFECSPEDHGPCTVTLCALTPFSPWNRKAAQQDTE